MTAIADVTPIRPLDQFETDYAAKRRRSKIGWTVAAVLFTLAFIFSAWLGDFF